jgi:hypothetical protein
MLQFIKDGDLTTSQAYFSEMSGLIAGMLDMINDDPCQRENRVSHIIEKVCLPHLFHHFFTSGALMKKKDIEFCNDEEYLGAVIAFSQELARYAVTRAGEVRFFHRKRLCCL